MKTIVVGTAGHVDHGKTALVRAVTGMDTDRLKEEKQRGISIDIGFAFSASDDCVIDFVDVPGHERFVRNMVCGVSGIDAAVLVVAADDGVMPQTREHLDILRLLGIRRGLIVLSKIDLVDDVTRMMAEEEIDDLVRGTFMEGAPIIGFSAVTREGVDAVKAWLERMAIEQRVGEDGQVFRLPVDKVYSAKGYGTVATGTVASGMLAIGEEVVVYPSGMRSKARSLQVHRAECTAVAAGQRAGVNLQGLDHVDLGRGDVIASPGSLRPSRIVNASFSLLESSERVLKHRERLKIYTGTKEVVVRVFFMDRESLEPGGTAFVQLRCEEEIVVLPGDPFISRSLSPQTTVGGGTILQPCARKYRRFDARVLGRMKALDDRSPESFVEDAVMSFGFQPAGVDELTPLTGFTVGRIGQIVKRLVKKGRILPVGDGFVHVDAFDEACGILESLLVSECERLKVTRKFKAASLRSKLPFVPAVAMFKALLVRLEAAGKIAVNGEEVTVGFFRAELNKRQRAISEAALRLARGSPSPVRFSSLQQICAKEASEVKTVLGYLAEERRIVLFKDFSFLSIEALEKIKAKLAERLRDGKSISLGEARDLLGIGRNPLQTILEYLDEIGFTKREGDVRKLSNVLISSP